MKHKDNSARTNRPYRHRLAFLLAVLLSVLVIGAASVGQQSPSAASSQQAVATIHVDASHTIKSFDPDVALGSSIDILPTGRSGQNLYSGDPQGVSLRRMGADHLSSKY